MKVIVGLPIFIIVALNFLGGIISGIWLAMLGQWWAIGYGFLGLFSHIWLGWPILFGIVFGGPAAYLMEKGRPGLAAPLIFLSQLYILALMSAWCLSVLHGFMWRADESNFWPLLIWSYGVALGPWMFLAKKDSQFGDDATSLGSTLTTLCAQIAYLITMALMAFGVRDLQTHIVVFGTIMMIDALVQTGFAIALTRPAKRFGHVKPTVY